MIERLFTGYVFNEEGEVVGCSFYLYDPERQIYQDFKDNKSYKRMKVNDIWTNWLEIIA